MADAKVLNLDKVKARLARLPAQVKAAAKHQLKVETDDLVAALKRAAPVGDELEKHPGQLRDSIEAYPSPKNELRTRIIVGARDAAGRLIGAWVEFGHHMARGGGEVPARPYFWPTYRARRRGMKRRMSAAVNKVFKLLKAEGWVSDG